MLSISRLQRVLILTGILSLLASYVGLWIHFINDPVERNGADFIAFYSAGRIAQQEGLSRVYDPMLQQDIQEKQVGFQLVSGQVLLYNHIPFIVPILAIMVNEDYVNSFHRWVVLLVVLYLASLTILGRILQKSGAGQRTALLTGLSAFLFLPLFFSLMNGQDTAFLFLGAALWMYGLVTGNELLAGLGLSLTTVRPHISIALALPMLFSHRKVFIVYVLGAGFLALFSFLIIGWEGVKQFVDILQISAGGEWHGMKEEAMVNLIGLLTRAIPTLGPERIRILGWLVYGLSLPGLVILWTRKNHLPGNLIGLTVVIALFSAPHLHFHDLTLLLIPIYELVYAGFLKRSTAPALPIAVSILLLISNISYFLQYTTPYLVMLALACYPFYLERRNSFTALNQSQSPEK